MNVIIVEDEHAAAKNLISIIYQIDKSIEILVVIESVNGLVNWVKNNNPPDLAFFDIELSDDNIFEAFTQVRIDFPIIFTTAYSEYAIDAFKVNGIDYLLKPINAEAVKFGINKYKSIESINSSIAEDKLRKILGEYNNTNQVNFKKSFLVQYKDRFIPIEASSFAFFYIDNGVVRGITDINKKYTLNNTLEELELLLDPDQFKRASRQYIINRKSIIEIIIYFNSKYRVNLNPPSPTKLILSKSKSSEIRRWLES